MWLLLYVESNCEVANKIDSYLIFSSPPHWRIGLCESFSVLMTMLISFHLLWIFSWLYPCIGRLAFNSQLNIAAASLLARFGRSLIISIEYSNVGSSLSFWSLRRICRKSYASLGPRYFFIASRFHRRWRRQIPCSSRSSCPMYVVVAPTYFPQITVTVEKSWSKWLQLE